MDPDPASVEPQRIPLVAWIIALASIAAAVTVVYAMPGPAMQGCLHAKSCFPVPKGPAWWAAGALVLGSMLSTAIGRIPRHWAVGWNVTLAAIATVILATIPLLTIDAWTPALARRGHGLELVEWVFATGIGSLLVFAALAVALSLVGLLTAALRPSPRVASMTHDASPDLRPRWQRELVAVHAALIGGARRLRSSESLLVAELAYALQSGELEIPPELASLGAQLLDLLSRDDASVRARVLTRLEQAMATADRRRQPYRSL